MDSTEIIEYWYSDNIKKHWFNSTAELDQQILSKFESLWHDANTGKLDDWKNSAQGCLALAIILDQFPLNMFRGKAKAFQSESKAIDTTLHAVEQGFHQQLDKSKVSFLIMPLMHSENLAEQDLSVKLFAELGLKQNLRFAEHHRDLVKEFGRFPHRNAILGRETSDEEMAYLESDKAFTG